MTLSIIGAGSWGSAIAIQAGRSGQPVLLWARSQEQAAEMAASRSNERFLPGYSLPDPVIPTSSLEQAVAAAGVVIIAVPSAAFRSVVQQISPLIGTRTPIVWLTKGFEHGSGRLLHEVVIAELGSNRETAIISGPSFARDVAAGQPTAVAVASNSDRLASELITILHHGHFRLYRQRDLIGVEVGGAVKNALAIAAGIADGLGFGANTRAALITRGLAEMMRLGVAMGGERETFMGLTGLGDLVLTCTDNQSRNRRFGLLLAEGRTTACATSAIGQVVEGVATAREVMRRAAELSIEMPIVEQVVEVIENGSTPSDAVGRLLSREPRDEIQ
jgi:glycerol-3-phosphate dehydrogenase (NAD(P)+)